MSSSQVIPIADATSVSADFFDALSQLRRRLGSSAARVRDASGQSHIGQRSRNEDAFGHDERAGVYVVADGMGGRPLGTLAARTVVDAILDRHANGHTKKTLEHAVVGARERLVQLAEGDPDRARMGTTVAALRFRGSRLATVVHVGDSRVYRLRDGRLDRLTDDHNVPGDLLVAGRLSRQAADVHPLRNVLTRFLSPDTVHAPAVSRVSVQPGDQFVLCSDGLGEMTSDDAIRACLIHSPTADEASRNLIRAAVDRDTHDNITAVVVRVAGR